MAVLTNSFEGGTTGTALSHANSGGASGTAFDTVTIGSLGTFQFDNSQAAHGSLSATCATSFSSASAFGYWGTSLGAGQTQLWFRMYLLFTQAPAQTHRIFTVWTTTSAGTICGSVNALTTKKIQVLSATSSSMFSTTATFPLSQWFRLEGFFIPSATVGQAEIKLFTTSPDAVTPDETDTSAATFNTGASIGSAGFGVSSNTLNVNAFWMDDIGVSTTGYLGPSVLTSPPVRAYQLNQAVNRSAVW